MKRVSTSVTPQEYQLLVRLAHLRGCSVPEVVHHAIRGELMIAPNAVGRMLDILEAKKRARLRELR